MLIVVSFSFSVFLIITHFTIFGNFLGPELLKHLQALNEFSFGKIPSDIAIAVIMSGVVLEDIFPTRYHMHQTEII